MSLKEGVELNQLHNGVILEIDTEAMQAQEPYPDDAEESFEGANVLEQLNTECIGFAGNNLSDSDNELVKIMYVRDFLFTHFFISVTV